MTRPADARTPRVVPRWDDPGGIEADVRSLIERGILTAETLYGVFQRQVAERGNVEAVLDARTSLTFSELDERIRLTAGRLSSVGLGKGDDILLQMPNDAEYLAVLFACLCLGIRPVLLLMQHRDQELLHVGRLIGAKAIVTTGTHLGFDHEEMALRVSRELDGRPVVLVEGTAARPGAVGLDEIEARPASPDPSVRPWDTALYLLSGGTTAVPKIIPKVHAAYSCVALASARRCEIGPDDTCLVVLSASHDFPLSSPGILGTLFTGGRVILSATASFDEVSGWLEGEEVTFTQAVPAVVSQWLREAQGAPERQRAEWRIGKLILGAAKVGTRLAQRLVETFGARIVQGYGLGEGITCLTHPGDPEEIAWNTQGTPVLDSDELRIVGPDGTQLPAGEIGEVIERGPYTFYGYHAAPHLNERAFDDQGFFHTGDAGFVGADGQLVITGRIREQINRAGENVIPSEVEELVSQHPGIGEVAVIGMPDPALGEATWAVVTLTGTAQGLDRAGLAGFLRELGVASYKWPDHLVVRETMPHKNIGKIDKNMLRDELAKAVRGDLGGRADNE